MSSVSHPAVRLLAAAATAALLSAPTWAATTTYSTEAAFLAAVMPGAYTEGFDGSPDAGLSYSYSGGGFDYTVTASPLRGFDDDVYLSGTFIGNLYEQASLTLTFTAGGPTAIGGNFYISDIDNAFVPNMPVTVTLSDGSSTTFTPTSDSAYHGFTSTVAISSLTLSAPGASLYNTIDNLTVGLAAVPSAVPEPASCALLAAGLAAIAGAARRRRG